MHVGHRFLPLRILVVSSPATHAACRVAAMDGDAVKDWRFHAPVRAVPDLTHSHTRAAAPGARAFARCSASRHAVGARVIGGCELRAAWGLRCTVDGAAAALLPRARGGAARLAGAARRTAARAGRRRGSTARALGRSLGCKRLPALAAVSLPDALRAVIQWVWGLPALALGGQRPAQGPAAAVARQEHHPRHATFATLCDAATAHGACGWIPHAARRVYVRSCICGVRLRCRIFYCSRLCDCAHAASDAART